MNIKFSPLYAESWNVAYRFLPEGSIIDDKSERFIIIPNSFRYWAADPMSFSYKGKKYIFAELYDYVKCRGVIGVSEYIDEKKCFGKWMPVIQEAFHMSYPFIFEFKGDIYIIPETSEAEELYIYRAVDFPVKWERYKTIKSKIKWADTTIIESDNSLIGFTYSLEDSNDLRIALDENFDLNRIEVLKNDNKDQFRSGGRIFYKDNYLVRICQDCKDDYGKALIFRFLDLNSFTELKSERISAQQLKFNKEILLDGMHTYSATNEFEVIDIKTRRFNVLNLLFRFIKKVFRKLH